jgi:hypothetical protein
MVEVHDFGCPYLVSTRQCDSQLYNQAGQGLLMSHVIP